MRKISLPKVDLDRVENVYLACLRVAVLGVATLCLLAALYFGANALWRVFVSTKVEVAPVQISAAEVAAQFQGAPSVQQARTAERQISQAIRLSHANWAREVWPKFYAAYSKASTEFKKPEDKTLSSQELMNALGYDINSYSEATISANQRAAFFIDNPSYQAQLLDVITATLAEPATVERLRLYKAARKTATSCSMSTEARAVWVPYSGACVWSGPPYGCTETRSTPVEVCVPAYPSGIVSPDDAVERADAEFFRLWNVKAERARSEARATQSDREATRAQIGPNLLLALQILGAFLVVMFFFLIVAIERHLRRASSAGRVD
jgi:hypothetical protein